MLQYVWEMRGKEHAIERNFTMNNDEVKLLSQMKKAINNGNKSFYQRKDRDYLLDLSNLGISLEEAWKEILTLNKHFYVLDKKPIYKIFQAKVTKITIDRFRVLFSFETLDENKYNSERTMEAFGETVFLTREEAEKALKEMEGKK